MNKLRKLTLATALLCASAIARAAPPAPEIVRFEDGLELVTWPQPDARRAALWMVVRAGGTSDPAGKAGLAHLVEHLVFGASHDIRGRTFFDEARAAGATVNAHTYPQMITFELDAPSGQLEALGARFLALVTSPAWPDAAIGRERGIIETEAVYHSSEGLLAYLDQAVFPAPKQGGPLVGTQDSRSQLEVRDAADFFSRNLAPPNITIVMTGAVTPAQARALVERSFRIPPPRPGEVASIPVERPALPVEQKVPAGVVVTLLGYPLEPADRSLCTAVASLLDLRLQLAVKLSNARVSSVSVGCHRLRGNDFLVASAFTSTLDVGDLPQAMERAVGGLASNPPNAQERALIQGRLDRRHRRALRDPIELVERIAALAAERTGEKTDLAGLVAAPLPTPARLGELVRRSFAKERQVLLNFSPMQN